MVKRRHPISYVEQEKARQIVQLFAQAGNQHHICVQMILLGIRKDKRIFVDPPKGVILHQKFKWKQFPCLEAMLKLEDNVKQAYMLQGKDKKVFYTNLEDLVLKQITAHGWIFEGSNLRERLRHFYKTMKQNASKRLRTMLRNLNKRANLKNLASLQDFLHQEEMDETYHLIEDNMSKMNSMLKLE